MGVHGSFAWGIEAMNGPSCQSRIGIEAINGPSCQFRIGIEAIIGPSCRLWGRGEVIVA